MERAILGITLRDQIRNKIIRERTGVKDVVEAAALKWRWAGHIARSPKDKWIVRILSWRPRLTQRSAGRPQTRWRDDISSFAGTGWMNLAQDRGSWKQMEEAFVQQWTATR